ncbi:hypothetical protein CYMTET_13034, partial [Cymbomonas tetramitiformis]
MRQVCIVPSGVQQWTRGVFAAGGGRFAFCSTLAIYIFRVRGFVLDKILVGHDKMITTLCWSPHDPNLIASASSDQVLKIWNVKTQTVVCELKNSGLHAQTLTWTLYDAYTLLITSGGAFRAWDTKNGKLNKIRDFREGTINCVSLSTRDKNKVALGLESGHVYLYNVSTDKTVKIDMNAPIIDVKWDPRSENYFLVALNDGRISLYDSETSTEMSVFARHAGGLRALAWVPEIPGGFVTVSDRNGVMRLWNVSQTSPVELLKTGKDGFHSILFISGDTALCAFKDGMVSVYNVSRKQVEWSTEGGHTETIFDCCFKSTDPNILATASYDSTVRLWDVRNAKCVSKLLGAKGVLYALTWSPDGTQLASCSSEGKINVYDVEKAIVVKTLAAHRSPAYRVVWNQRDPNLLASASADSLIAVSRVSQGDFLTRLQHPQAVFGVAWSTFNTHVLASACQDGNVYVWGVDSKQQPPAPITILKGHRAKVFNVAWSPLLPDTLLSGSDDRTAIVWNVKSGEKTVLTGHTSNVRGLLWHAEIPFLVITGSWDATIRLWDIRTGVCIKVVEDHHADVYGISAHPQRPFVLATASRDTTIRMWSLDQLYCGLKVRALMGSNVCGTVADNARSNGDLRRGMVLSGPGSSSLLKQLESAQTTAAKYGAVFNFFSLPAGTFEPLFAFAKRFPPTTARLERSGVSNLESPGAR